MPLVIPDDILRQAGLDEKEALVEFACRLFDAGKLALWPAAALAGMERGEFETQLRSRKISIYSPTLEDLKDDLLTLERLAESRP